MIKKNKLLSLLVITILFIMFLFLLPGAGYADDVLQGEDYKMFFWTYSIIESMEEFLIIIAMEKFIELQDDGVLSALSKNLREIKEFYVPYAVWQDFDLFQIVLSLITPASNISGQGFLGRVYASDLPPLILWYIRGNEAVDFSWFLHQQADKETLPLIRVQHIHDYEFQWGQHGQIFSARVPRSLIEDENFCEEKLDAFLTAVPLITWEIQGNAVSVSIQGMENINVFDAKDSEIIMERFDFGPFQTHREIYMLYRLNDDGTRDKIGYRWPINEEWWINLESLHRYQYVLKPGIYTFNAEGVIGEQGLLVRHFVDHEIVSSKDYTEKFSGQPVNQFILTIDGLALEQTLRLEQNMRRLILTLDSPIITDLIHGTVLTMNVSPLLQEGRTLIPVRFIAEKLGAHVKWDEMAQTIAIILNGQEVSLVVGELTGEMDVPAQIIDGRTMVPLRFVAESLDADVSWNPVTRTIEVIRYY